MSDCSEYSLIEQPAIARALMDIEAARAVVEQTPLPPAAEAELRHRARIRSTHYSTSIEGKKAQFHGRERDVGEVKNYWNALLRVEEWAAKKIPFTEELVRRLHALIKEGARAKPTPYRDGQNAIRDSASGAIIYLPPEAKDVPSLMIALVEWVHRAEKEGLPVPLIAGLAHYQFVTIHPYYDGNGRTARLLDIVENFMLFGEASGGIVKLVAKNHQYLGVNNATEALKQIEQNRGRLGVFWHTQGSGKSYSMVFFSQKVLRKIPGNFTFVIVTDRQDLDNQIYKNFAGAGAVTEEQVQAESGEHLKQLLREDHRYIFTLIQKFHKIKHYINSANMIRIGQRRIMILSMSSRFVSDSKYRVI